MHQSTRLRDENVPVGDDDYGDLPIDSQSFLNPFDTLEPPIDFDRWVALAAQLQRVPSDQRDEWLAKLNLEPEVWDACDRHYVQLLGAELKKPGGQPLIERYSELCKTSGPPSNIPVNIGETSESTTSPIDIDQTACITALSFTDPIPFHSCAQPMPPPRAALELRTNASDGETQELRLDNLELGAIPFSTVDEDEYVNICASLATEQKSREAILRSHGIESESAFQGIVEAFAVRMNNDPALRYRIIQKQKSAISRHLKGYG